MPAQILLLWCYNRHTVLERDYWEMLKLLATVAVLLALTPHWVDSTTIAISEVRYTQQANKAWTTSCTMVDKCRVYCEALRGEWAEKGTEEMHGYVHLVLGTWKCSAIKWSTIYKLLCLLYNHCVMYRKQSIMSSTKITFNSSCWLNALETILYYWPIKSRPHITQFCILNTYLFIHWQ